MLRRIWVIPKGLTLALSDLTFPHARIIREYETAALIPQGIR